MARPKNSTALYEVIDKRSDPKPPARQTVPGWWRSKVASSSWRPSSARSAGKKPKSAPPPRPVSTTDEQVADRPPFVQIRGGRVELSLNPVSSAIMVGVVFLAVFTSYQLGSGLQPAAPVASLAGADSDRTTGVEEPVTRAGTTDPVPTRLSGIKPTPRREVEQRRNMPLTRLPVLSDLKPARRVAGLNYVILESFQVAHRDDAVHAQDWFAQSQGIRTTLEKSGQRWQLISTEGFDYDKASDKDRCQQFCETIKALGRAYKREFAGRLVIRYGFQSPMVKKF